MNVIKKRIIEIKDNGEIVMGVDILLYLHPASMAGIQVNLPTGAKKKLSSFLVGMDRQPHLYFSFPAVTAEEMISVCHPGYKVNVSVLCEKGAGAVAYFDSMIEKVSADPPLLTIKAPEYITMNRIRKETRYPVSIDGWSQFGESKLPLQLIDISAEGCAFKVHHLSTPLKIKQYIQIFMEPFHEQFERWILSGEICNQRKLLDSIVYGIKFDEHGLEQCKILFSHLEFNGQIMVAKST